MMVVQRAHTQIIWHSGVLNYLNLWMKLKVSSAKDANLPIAFKRKKGEGPRRQNNLNEAVPP